MTFNAADIGTFGQRRAARPLRDRLPGWLARNRPSAAAFAVLITWLLGAALAPTQARADLVTFSGAEVAPNIAEIRIDRDGVHVALEIYVGDIARFADLLPRAKLPEDARATAAPDAQRLERFARTGLTIRDDRGRLLPVELRLMEPRQRVDRKSPLAGTISPITGRRVPAPPEDPRVLYTELFYPFADPLPGKITISPPLEPGGAPAVTIGMIVFHHAVPVIDFRYLGAASQLALDWSDPWFSKFDNPVLTRHHRNPNMTFLYAEPYEIRHEVLIRARLALELTGTTTMPKSLTGPEADALIRSVAAFIAQRSPMTIDGKPVTPDFDRGAFMRIGPRGLLPIQPGEAIDVDAALIGLIWSAPTDGLPKEAAVTWSIFDQDQSQVPGFAIDAAGPFVMALTPDDPILSWTNSFKKPLVPPISAVDAQAYATMEFPALSGVLWLAAAAMLVVVLRRRERGRRLVASVAGAVAIGVVGYLLAPVGKVAVPRPGFVRVDLNDQQAGQIAERLLTNVYRAFDFRGEGQVYDRLALTVDGALLEKVYLDQRKSLRIARAGGAEARVEKLSVESAAVSAASGGARDIVVRVRWQILGRVGHWGHVHQRQNAYEADLTISPSSGNWKIIGFDVLAQDRLS